MNLVFTPEFQTTRVQLTDATRLLGSNRSEKQHNSTGIDELHDAIVMPYRIDNTEIVFCHSSFQTPLLEAKWQSRTYVFEVGRLNVRFPTPMRQMSE
jgi:hypothetical protein